MLQPWFAEAKLGIFLHWGIYAVQGVGESWSFFNGNISYEDYMAQLDGFTADRYDPDAWADLFKRTGAGYAVLTTKHHDGVALWDTALSDLNVAQKSPAGRDLIGPYCDALRKHGLKVGLYFSHLDWSHPDYRSVFRAGATPPPPEKRNPFNAPAGEEDPEAWTRFLQFHRGQLKELCERYRPDLLWFDGDWERTEDQWNMAELRDQLHAWAPGVMLNSRMGKHGDYKTPEQAVPILRPDGVWEFCMTMNDAWGYRPSDTHYKTLRQIVYYFVQCISMGGNLLLDAGPKPDGTLPEEQVALLEGLGAWNRQHAEAIFPTGAGLPPGHTGHATTCSKDRKTLYVFIFDPPAGPIPFKGLRSPVESVDVLHSGEKLAWDMVGGAPWAKIPGVLWVDAPKGPAPEPAQVLRIRFTEPLTLFREETGAIEAN